MHKSKKNFKKYTKKVKSTNKKYFKKYTKKNKTKKNISINLVKRRKTLNINPRVIISPFHKKIFIKGGNYNTVDIELLKKILIGYGYNNVQILYIINKFNIMSQKYPFKQLKPQIVNINNREKTDFSNLSQDEITEGRSDIQRVLRHFENEINNLQEGDTDVESIDSEDEDNWIN
jgi:putative ribosome biogenesis GTPase RsgA